MRKMLVSVAALLLSAGLAFAGGIGFSIPDQATFDEAMVWQVKSTRKVKKPLETRPIKKPPSGAREATQGQKGRCICSTNAQGNTTCTGNCR